MGLEGAPYGRSDPSGEIPTLLQNIFLEGGENGRGKEKLRLFWQPVDVRADVPSSLRRGASLRGGFPEEREGGQALRRRTESDFPELLNRGGAQRLRFLMFVFGEQ